MTNFGAGHETMCSALTAALAMVGSHAAAQQRIAHEVLALETPPPGSGGPISYDSVARRLPYTLAAHPRGPAPAPGHRHVAAAHRPPWSPLPPARPGPAARHYGGLQPCGPAPQPRRLRARRRGLPARSLAGRRGGRGEAQDMLGCNLIWGGGARTCPGRHLAELIVHKAVPLLVREFDVRVAMPPRHPASDTTSWPC